MRGHAGLNRVRFAGRVHGRALGPGTYRISARTPNGRVVQRIILVIVSGGAPSRDELEAARASNVCAEGAQSNAGSSASSLASNPLSSSGEGASLPMPHAQASASSIAPPPAVGPSGVLASSIEQTARAIRPLFVLLLAAAILLLGLASLPQTAVPEPRVNDMLARHRLEIAGVGAAALVGTVLAFLLV